MATPEEDLFYRLGQGTRAFRQLQSEPYKRVGRAVKGAVNTAAGVLSGAAGRFGAGLEGPQPNPLTDEITRLRNRSAVMRGGAGGAPAAGSAPATYDTSGADTELVPPLPAGRLSALGTNYLRTGEIPERRVYDRMRGGYNLPGNSAYDVEAGLARSPIMAMAERMRSAKIQEEKDALDAQQRNFISTALQGQAQGVGAGTIGDALRTRANTATAMGLERNRTARDVAEGKNVSDTNIAQIGAGAALGAAGARARASELTARYGLAGSEATARARENAARIGAAGNVGAAQVTAAGRPLTMENVAAFLYQSGNTDEANRITEQLHQQKQPQAARMFPMPGVPGMTEPGFGIAEPGKQPTFRTQKELSDLVKQQDRTAAAQKVLAKHKGAAEGTVVQVEPGVIATMIDGEWDFTAGTKPK